jgi:hypothetical protein
MLLAVERENAHHRKAAAGWEFQHRLGQLGLHLHQKGLLRYPDEVFERRLEELRALAPAR